jgi:CBS domain containing-hemolysin-like protein
MTRDPLRAPASLTADTFLLAAMSESRASTWLVTGPGGVVTGLLGLDRLRSVRGEARRTTRIGELAQPIDTAATVFADEQVIDVLKRFEGRETRAVVRERWSADEADSEAIAGLLTPEDVSRAIEVGRMADGGDARTSSPDRGTSEGPVWP